MMNDVSPMMVMDDDDDGQCLTEHVHWTCSVSCIGTVVEILNDCCDTVELE